MYEAFMLPDFCTPPVSYCFALGQMTACRNIEAGHHSSIFGIHFVALLLRADTCSDTHLCHASESWLQDQQSGNSARASWQISEIPGVDDRSVDLSGVLALSRSFMYCLLITNSS